MFGFFLLSFLGRFRGQAGKQSRLDFARPRPYFVAGARYIFTLECLPETSNFVERFKENLHLTYIFIIDIGWDQTREL